MAEIAGLLPRGLREPIGPYMHRDNTARGGQVRHQAKPVIVGE
jgi:hypothetical protein